MPETPMGAASQDPNDFESRQRSSLLRALNDALRRGVGGVGAPRSLRALHDGPRGGVGGGVARSLRATRDALRAYAIDVALRTLDQAWRCLPESAATLAPIYARLLMLDGGDSEAALHLLKRAAGFAPDPDLAALMALALLRLRRPDDARRELEAALAAYCVVPEQLLFPVAGEVMQHPDIAAPGWIGRGPHLELVGELSSPGLNHSHPGLNHGHDESTSVLDIRTDGEPAITQILRVGRREGRRARAFSFELPHLRTRASLEVMSHGVPLLGSGSRIPLEFALDGRVESRGRRVTGWARIGWSPRLPVRLRIEDETGRGEPLSSRAMLPAHRWGFTMALRGTQLSGSRIEVKAQLPDGGWQALPDSPLLLEPAVRLEDAKPRHMGRWAGGLTLARSGQTVLELAVGVKTVPEQARVGPAVSERAPATEALLGQAGVGMAVTELAPVDVVIPVYGGREATLACLDAVLATVDDATGIVVVDDASEDAALVAALDALAEAGSITLVRNAANQGFVASVNSGLAVNPAHDAVLLNSDTRVYDDWLARLRAAAYRDPAVGTVTPLSNQGSIASYPRAQGAAIEPQDAAALHALAAATHSGIHAEIPVGVGHCLYVRRDCLREVGALDTAVFGLGYGEETDFCLRARRRGWSHRLAADVFVYHAGGLSFGGRRGALWERSQRLLNLRHPGFDRHIASFLAQDPLMRLRRALDERRLLAFEGRCVLLVTLALTGGVERFVTERCREVRAQGLFPLLLRAAAPGDLTRCELWTDALEVPNLRYDIPAELPDLNALLRALRVEAIEIQHFLHLDARVIEAVRALPVPVDVVVHDYAWICPRVTLIDGSGGYCGEPAVAVCEACVQRHGSYLGETLTVAALRARSARWLRAARRVVAPSADTAARLQRHFDGLVVVARPHTTSVTALGLPRAARADRVRVAVLGAIGEHKGYRVLLECARDARARHLPIEFVVIGYTENDVPLNATGKVFITGRYGEAEAAHLLRREQPNVLWLPSVWPETWCYTLDYALGSGLPVLAFDLGAIAERLRAAGQGELVPLATAPQQINDCLLGLAASARPDSVNASRFEQTPAPLRDDDATIGITQIGEMPMLDHSGSAPTEVVPFSESVQAQNLSASAQVLPLPAGLYLIAVKSGGAPSAPVNGQAALPALHVGLGPGMRPTQVEFMADPVSDGGWLYTSADLLVIKVHSPGATLILTSVHAPAGDILAVKVERLNGRVDEPALGAAPAARPPEAQTAAADPHQWRLQGTQGDLPLRTTIGLHIRTRGDISFADVPWAGRLAPGLWIESFSVRPQEGLAPQDIEYKGLTGSGYETPWLSNGMACGTQGMGVPLVGFALRLKPGAQADAYDCEYSGYFESGVTVGPVGSGVPCCSSVANDPLEGIQVRFVKRGAAPAQASPEGTAASATARGASAAERQVGRGA
jgi:GT2 family glycosyltransferase